MSLKEPKTQSPKPGSGTCPCLRLSRPLPFVCSFVKWRKWQCFPSLQCLPRILRERSSSALRKAETCLALKAQVLVWGQRVSLDTVSSGALSWFLLHMKPRGWTGQGLCLWVKITQPLTFPSTPPVPQVQESQECISTQVFFFNFYSSIVNVDCILASGIQYNDSTVLYITQYSSP